MHNVDSSNKWVYTLPMITQGINLIVPTPTPIV